MTTRDTTRRVSGMSAFGYDPAAPIPGLLRIGGFVAALTGFLAVIPQLFWIGLGIGLFGIVLGWTATPAADDAEVAHAAPPVKQARLSKAEFEKHLTEWENGERDDPPPTT